MQTNVDEIRPVVSLPLLAVLLAASVGLSWLMVPRQGELIERLFKDKQYERVSKVLQDEVHGMAASELGGLRKMDGDQIEGIARLLYLTPREQLRAVFQSSRPPAYNEYVHHIVLAAVRYIDVVPPQEALELMAPQMGRVPVGMQPDIYRLIANNYHALGKPAQAASVLQMAAQVSPEWEIAREMAESYRWGGQPGEGARRLTHWLMDHEAALKAAQREEALRLTYAMAMESGDPSAAFDVCVKELRGLPQGQPFPPELMQRTLDTALQASRTNDFTPWIKLHLSAMSAASLPLGELRAESLAQPEALANHREWLTRFALWSDWNSRFDDSFDAHLRLAAMGELNSLDRCLALFDFLGRAEECAELLSVLGPVKERPQLALLHAHQLAELGHEAASRQGFEAWLQTHPDDRDARYDYCCLLADMGDEEGARLAFRELLKRYPSDTAAMKKTADCLILAADYQGALDLYARLPDSAHDHDTLENYAMLAESTDDHEAGFTALTLAARLAKEPSTEMYLEIAEAGSYLEDPERTIAALSEGLARMPASAALRIALANTFLHADQPDKALTTLLHPVLKDSFEAAQVLLSLTDEVSDPAKVLAFLGDDVERRYKLSDHNLLQLAVLNQSAGRRHEADRILASVKEAPNNYRILAETHFQLGNSQEAARLMSAHLKSHPSSPPAEWLFLGDIYEQMGRFDEAKKAFDFSITMLTDDLPGTAAN